MASIIKMRSALTQADFNDRMGKLVSYEFAYAAIVVGLLLWYYFTWQWFFWGIIITVVTLAIGISIPYIADLIIIIFSLLWAAPFWLLASLGIDAFYVFAVIAFIISIWVHAKAFTFYADLSRWD